MAGDYSRDEGVYTEYQEEGRYRHSWWVRLR